MKNNPQFTAYALGELSEEEKTKLLAELKEQGKSLEDIEQEKNNIRDLALGLKEEFQKDDKLRLAPGQREAVFPKRKTNWKKWFAGASVSFACFIAYMIIAPQFIKFHAKKPGAITGSVFTKSDSLNDELLVDSTSFDVPAASVSKSKSFGYKKGRAKSRSYPNKMIKKAEKFNREGYEKIDNNPYVLVANQALSTFSVDVDTASYGNLRRFLFRGTLPPKDSIRVEEMINYFHYNYDVSFNDHPVGIKVDQAVSPWHKERKLVRVALKADSPSNLLAAKKNLVFLLDVSGSMNSAKKLPLLKEAMKLLVRKLKPTDTMSLVVYAGAAGVVLEPTPVKEKLKIFRALENLKAGGSTNGGGGIKAAYKMAKQNFIKGGVNRVILATDGDFNVGTSSQASLIDLIEEKAKNDIFLTVVGLGMGNYQDAMLEKISNRGNGNYAYIDSLSEANKLFNIDLEKNLTTVAKDVKVQIEFNPSKVQAYRLIGYENRMLKAQDFNNDKKDAGEMGAGHTVTALYEIISPGAKLEIIKIDKLKYQKAKTNTMNDNDELLTVKVRYKRPTEKKSNKFDIVLKDGKNEFKKMDLDFRFATAVASLGMKLRNDKMVEDLRYRDIENMAKESKGTDPFDFREEFIELIDFAKQIDK